MHGGDSLLNMIISCDENWLWQFDPKLSSNLHNGCQKELEVQVAKSREKCMFKKFCGLTGNVVMPGCTQESYGYLTVLCKSL